MTTSLSPSISTSLSPVSEPLFGVASTVQSLGALSIDTVVKTVRIYGEHVDLSAKEFGIVEALMRQPGAVVSKEALEESFYGWGQEIASNAVEVHLHFLRKNWDPT